MTRLVREHEPADAWIASRAGSRLRTHAGGLLAVESARLGHRWRMATPADLLGEIRDELAAVAARAGLTATALDARTVPAGNRARIDAALLSLLAAVEDGYGELTQALDGTPHHEPEPVEIDPADELTEREQAAEAIRRVLADGPRRGADVKAAVTRELECPVHVVRAAARDLGVTTGKAGDPGSTWALPGDAVPAESATLRELAADAIRQQLADGPRRGGEVIAAVIGQGFTRGTVNAAAATLDLVRTGSTRATVWALPEPDAGDDGDQERAAAMIADALADGGWHPVGPILARVVGAGIARAVAHAAAEALDLDRERRDGHACWRRVPVTVGGVEHEPVEAAA